MVNVEAKLSYQENCDYLPSSITDEIDIEPRDIDIDTTITILNHDKREFTPKGFYQETKSTYNQPAITHKGTNDGVVFRPYYNDELKFEVYTSLLYDNVRYPVKYNDIDIYYFNEDEDRTVLNPDDLDHIIATNIKIDENGQVAVRYLPHNSGYFVVHYHATTYFKEQIVEHQVTLFEIPTKVYIRPVEAFKPNNENNPSILENVVIKKQPTNDDDYTIIDYNNDSIARREHQGVGIQNGGLTTWSFVIWNVVRGKAYLNTGWNNSSNWEIEFDIQDVGSFNSPSELILIRDINEATYANQLRRCIAIQTNGKIFTCDDEKQQTIITNISNHNLIPNDTDKKVHFTITKQNNDYVIHIYNATTDDEQTINFTSDVLNHNNDLHLWLTCVSNDRGSYTLSNTKYTFQRRKTDNTNLLPIFISMEQAVDLAASVRDTYGQRPQSGAITFLSYYVHDIENPNDGQERVIGNPILLENGETFHYDPAGILFNDNKEDGQQHQYEVPSMGNTIEGPDPTQDNWKHIVYGDGVASGFISYSPIQYLYDSDRWEGDENEPGYNTNTKRYQSNTELIRAVYNYEDKNDIYGASWKYYGMHSGWTQITALIPGQLNLSIRKKNMDAEELWQIREDGLYPYTSNDTMVVYVAPVDSDGNIFDLSIDDKHEFYNITFKIVGTRTVPQANNTTKFVKYTHIFIKNTQDNELTYDNNTKMFKFEIPLGQKATFYDENGNLTERKFTEGIYSIEAYLDIITDEQYEDDDENARFNLYYAYHEDNSEQQWKDDRYYDHMESKRAYYDLIIESPIGTSTGSSVSEGPFVSESCYFKDQVYDIPVTIPIKNAENITAFNGKKVYLLVDNEELNDNSSYAILNIDSENNQQLIATFKAKNIKQNNNEIGLQNISGMNHYVTAVIKESDVSILNDDYYSPPASFGICVAAIPYITNIEYISEIYKGDAIIYITVDNVYYENEIVTNVYYEDEETPIHTQTNYVYPNDYTFNFELKNLRAGNYRVTTICTQSQESDEDTFKIKKASLYEIINTSSCITGGDQTITAALGCDGNIEDVQELLCHIGKKITYHVPLDKWTDIIPIRSGAEQRLIESTGQDFGLIKLEDNKLICNAFYLYRLNFYDGCAAVAHQWMHGIEWEVSFNIYSANQNIETSGSVFIADEVPPYNSDWVNINNIEINSGGNIYLHYSNDTTKTIASAYHPENQYGGALHPHYFNENMRVVLRYGNRLFTCQNCQYEVNRPFEICPMCGSNNVTHQSGNFYTVLQENNGQSDYFNFTFDGFNYNSQLHIVLWNYGGIGHGNGLTLSNIYFIHEEFLLTNNIKLLENNTLQISSKDDIIDEGEYQYRIIYDGDENYNDLRPWTYDIRIWGTSQDGTLTKENNNTFKLHYKNYNTQFVIGILYASNSENTIRLPIITKINGEFTIENIDNWESYTEFELHKNPKDEELLEIMEISNTNDVYENLVYYYENHEHPTYGPVQFNKSLAISLHNQWIENEYKVLFTTYNGTTIH